MTKLEAVTEALELCSHFDISEEAKCSRCPYLGVSANQCMDQLMHDALVLLTEREPKQLSMFDEDYGKEGK